MEQITAPPLLKGLGGRLLAALAFVALISVGALGLAVYLNERDALETQVTNQLTSIADLKKEQLLIWLDERQADAHLLAINKLNQDHFTQILSSDTPSDHKAELTEFLTDNLIGMQQSRAGYSEITLVDIGGRVIVATNPLIVGQATPHKLSVSQALEAGDGSYIRDIQLDPVTGIPTMNFSQTVLGLNLETGEELPTPIGVVIIVVDMTETIYPLIEAWPGMGATGETLLVRAEDESTLFLNNLRFDANAALNLRIPAEMSMARPAHLATRGAEGVGQHIDYRGVPILAAYRYIPGINWGFVAKEDLDEAFAPTQTLARQIGLVAIIVLLATGAVSIAISSTLTRPLAKLVEGTRAVATGNLKTDIAVKRQDEIGTLADSFRMMVQAVEHRQQQIETANQALQRRSIELSALYDLSLAVNSSLELTEVLHMAVNQTNQLLEGTRAGIFLLDDEGILSLNASVELDQAVDNDNRLAMVQSLWARFQNISEPIQVLKVADLGESYPLAPYLLNQGVKSIELLKLSHNDIELGLLTVLFPKAEVTDAEAQLARIIAQIISPAIAHAQRYTLTYAQLQQTNRRLEAASQISRHLSAILDTDQLLTEIVPLVQRGLGYDHIGVGILEGDEIVFRTLSTGETNASSPMRLKRGQDSLADQVITSGQSLSIPDVKKDFRCYLHPVFPKMRSQLTLPICLADETLGVLIVGDDQVARFDNDDQTLLQAIADQLALALQNARLYGQMREKAIQALKDSEERLRSIYNAANDAIFLIDPEQNYIIDANPRACEMLGYGLDELINLPVEKIHPTEMDLIQELWISALQNGLGQSNELSCLTKDGATLPVEASFSKVLIRNRNYILAMVRDVTERQRLEERLRQSQKMEAIGQLAGGVAHDFNNLLTVITGYSELMLASLTDDRMRRDMEQIQKSGERAAALTRQLLVFSRKQNLQPKVLDLNSIVAETHKMLGRLIGEDIELVTNLEPALKRITADPGQIEQVILNLAINARDAMPRGGKLTITTANVDQTEQGLLQSQGLDPGSYTLLTLSDNGVGMDAPTQERIFEPFFTTKEPGKGTGLGLATVYGIVSQSGGAIRVESQLGQGTTFKIFLPQHEEAPAGKPHTIIHGEPEATLVGTETILLVEDAAGVRKLTRDILQRYGHHTLEAGNGLEALQIAQTYRTPIHLLLTDVIMPHMSGPELAKKVVNLHPETRVLYMSGYTDNIVLQQDVETTEAKFIQKPFTPQILMQKIRNLLDDKALSENI